jgi:hypothetical protein
MLIFILGIFSISSTHANETTFKEIHDISAGKEYLALKIPFKNGLPNSKVTAYHDSGKIFAEQNYVDGIKDGEGFLQWESSVSGLSDPISFHYSKGLLHGEVKEKGKVIHQFENGFPKDWKATYKNPFSTLTSQQRITSPKGLKLKCGNQNYSEETGDFTANTIQLFQKNDQLIAVRCLSEGGGCGEGQQFTATTTDQPDADQFITYKVGSDEGELRLRVLKVKEQLAVQAYGYLRSKPQAITKDDLKKQDREIRDLFTLRFDYDTQLRYGLDKIELKCKK